MDVPVRVSSRTEGADMSVIGEELGPQATTVCVVGLGYVGLPVAVEFGKQRPTVGFDLATKKVERLKEFNDVTGEVSPEELQRFIDSEIARWGKVVQQAGLAGTE